MRGEPAQRQRTQAISTLEPARMIRSTPDANNPAGSRKGRAPHEDMPLPPAGPQNKKKGTSSYRRLATKLEEKDNPTELRRRFIGLEVGPMSSVNRAEIHQPHLKPRSNVNRAEIHEGDRPKLDQN
ncbi:hypothetical protein R1flu_003497 [Riccia fluitans]|uniref:Uncharacterized protein n=1 Tax=Riccia fluitans TaxID=41844 RepID=A0ABD1Y968_9MARC